MAEHLLSLKEASVILGITPKTLRLWCDKGELAFHIIGNRRWFLQTDLEHIGKRVEQR